MCLQAALQVLTPNHGAREAQRPNASANNKLFCTGTEGIKAASGINAVQQK